MRLRHLLHLPQRVNTMRMFDGLHRYALTGQGDVKMLQGKHADKLRLRLGAYRLFFSPQGHILRVLAIKHRSALISEGGGSLPKSSWRSSIRFDSS